MERFRKPPPDDSHRILHIRSRGVEDKLRGKKYAYLEAGSAFNACRLPIYILWRKANMNENHNYHRGDIYLADLHPYIGSEQGGTRPVLVLQNNAGNFFSPTLIVAPITSRVWKKAKQPTHCRIKGTTCLGDTSVVLLEQIKTIDKRRIKKYIGKLEEDQMREVDTCIEISLGLHIPEETEMA